MSIFYHGNGVIVNTKGPGKLHLLSYGGKAGIQNVVGYVETAATGITRFLISHTYSHNCFAFYWEGKGEAVYGAGNSLIREPLATTWRTATSVEKGAPFFTTHDVRAEADHANVKNGEITVFIIPNL